MNQALENREYCFRVLSFVYRLMVSTEPLLQLAASCSSGALQDYYVKHLEEERNHHKWLLEDLQTFKLGEPAHYHTAAEIAGSQYYFLYHDHPALFLGYMHALEKRPKDLEMIGNLEAMHGVQLKTLRHHAKEDPSHCQEIEAQIHAHPEAIVHRIAWNEHCVDSYIQQCMVAMWLQVTNAK